MHRPRKRLGQNFLVDPNIRRKIANALEAGPDDEVLEIGPGHGALTDLLAGNVRRLIAVELDNELAHALQERYKGRDDLVVLNQDILGTDLRELTQDPAKLLVIGNIPYLITTPILFHLLRREWRPAHIVLMVQREVADRLLATAGQDSYGALSIGVQTVAHVDRIFHVGRNAFRPVPNVDSTVIRIRPIRPFPLDEREEADLRTLTATAFQRRRKQLQRTLRSAPAYRLEPERLDAIAAATGIDLQRRPETLEPADFIRLARVLRNAGLPRTDA